MKKQYCKICGTLLPEDGICLRCGAVYHFADDGKAVEPVRKVKKVSVKPAKKKGIIVKRAVDPSEAETKTIPIPEEIYSHSNQSMRKEKYADWTGDEKEDVSFKKEPAYEPNVVLVDEEPAYRDEPYQAFYTEPTHNARAQEPLEYDIPLNQPLKKETKSPISTGMLVAIFLLSALLAGVVTFLLLGNSFHPKRNSLEETTVTFSTVEAGSTTTAAVQTTAQTRREAMRDAYNDVLDSFLESSDELVENRYYLADLDHNGTPELLVQYNYNGITYTKMAVFTYDDKIQVLGKTSGVFDFVLKMGDELYTFFQHMGSEIELNQLSIENQQLMLSSTIADYGIEFYQNMAIDGYDVSYRGGVDKLTE